MNESHSSIAHSQVGLAQLSKHMIFATYHLKPEAVEGEQSLDTYERVKMLANEFAGHSRAYGSFVITALDLNIQPISSRRCLPTTTRNSNKRLN